MYIYINVSIKISGSITRYQIVYIHILHIFITLSYDIPYVYTYLFTIGGWGKVNPLDSPNREIGFGSFVRACEAARGHEVIFVFIAGPVWHNLFFFFFSCSSLSGVGLWVSMGCPWGVRGVSAGCPWNVRGCRWGVRGVAVGCPLDVRGVSVGCRRGVQC